MIDLKEEMREDMRMEAREEAYIESKCREDFDFAIEQLGLDKDTTVDEFGYMLKTLGEWGYSVSADELLEYM